MEVPGGIRVMPRAPILDWYMCMNLYIHNFIYIQGIYINVHAYVKTQINKDYITYTSSFVCLFIYLMHIYIYICT